MSKKYQRPDKDFTIISIKWLIESVRTHTRAGFDDIPDALVYRRFFQLVKFLQIRNLTDRYLINEIDEINASSELKNSDLNDNGFYFLQSCIDKWSNRLYKDQGEDKEWKYLEKWLRTNNKDEN